MRPRGEPPEQGREADGPEEMGKPGTVRDGRYASRGAVARVAPARSAPPPADGKDGCGGDGEPGRGDAGREP